MSDLRCPVGVGNCSECDVPPECPAPPTPPYHSVSENSKDNEIENLKKIIEAREYDIDCLESERRQLLDRVAELEDALLMRNAVGGVH